MDDLCKQLIFSSRRSGDFDLYAKAFRQNVLELRHEMNGRDDVELTTQRAQEYLAREASKEHSGHEDVGIEHDAHLARPRSPSCFDCADDLVFCRTRSPRSLSPGREDPLPALESGDVLAECFAQQLAPTPALRTRHAIHFASQARRQ